MLSVRRANINVGMMSAWSKKHFSVCLPLLEAQLASRLFILHRSQLAESWFACVAGQDRHTWQTQQYSRTRILYSCECSSTFSRSNKNQLQRDRRRSSRRMSRSFLYRNTTTTTTYSLYKRFRKQVFFLLSLIPLDSTRFGCVCKAPQVDMMCDSVSTLIFTCQPRIEHALETMFPMKNKRSCGLHNSLIPHTTKKSTCRDEKPVVFVCESFFLDVTSSTQ